MTREEYLRRLLALAAEVGWSHNGVYFHAPASAMRQQVKP